MNLTKELVVSTNIALAITTLIVKIPPSSIVMYNQKREEFIGLNFQIWQHKMLFYVTILNLRKFLSKKCQSCQIINLISLLW
jgi:hypothetical protein